MMNFRKQLIELLCFSFILSVVTAVVHGQQQRDMIRRHPNCINIDGVSGLRAAFEWKISDDRQQITGAVHFPRPDLSIGWAALGISNFVGFGMNDADILLAWPRVDGTVQFAFKRAMWSGQPGSASAPLFESCWAEELGGRLVVHFSKKVSYDNVPDSVKIVPNQGAILSAVNTRETPQDENTFSFHTWRLKRYVNFLTEETIDECGGIFPSPSQITQPPPSTSTTYPTPSPPVAKSSVVPAPSAVVPSPVPSDSHGTLPTSPVPSKGENSPSIPSTSDSTQQRPSSPVSTMTQNSNTTGSLFSTAHLLRVFGLAFLAAAVCVLFHSKS